MIGKKDFDSLVDSASDMLDDRKIKFASLASLFLVAFFGVGVFWLFQLPLTASKPIACKTASPGEQVLVCGLEDEKGGVFEIGVKVGFETIIADKVNVSDGKALATFESEKVERLFTNDSAMIEARLIYKKFTLADVFSVKEDAY